MVQPIVRDPIILAQKSAPASKADLQTARDLLDTLLAHRDSCVGMAANMIGVHKRIIVFCSGAEYLTMLNPEIIEKYGPYEAEEACLSLPGVRKTKRWRKIKVRFQDTELKSATKSFSDFTAQIIQHEIDHCSGILV